MPRARRRKALAGRALPRRFATVATTDRGHCGRRRAGRRAGRAAGRGPGAVHTEICHRATDARRSDREIRRRPDEHPPTFAAAHAGLHGILARMANILLTARRQLRKPRNVARHRRGPERHREALVRGDDLVARRSCVTMELRNASAVRGGCASVEDPATNRRESFAACLTWRARENDFARPECPRGERGHGLARDADPARRTSFPRDTARPSSRRGVRRPRIPADGMSARRGALGWRSQQRRRPRQPPSCPQARALREPQYS
jgi:hypothetical protein